MNNIKKLFETPKKAIITSVCAVAIIGTIGTGTSYATGYIARNSSIGAENAQKFAFADAGIDPASAKISRTEFDYEDGKFVYEVKFIADGKEYEYYINADDGSVLKKDVELKSPQKAENKIKSKEQIKAAAKNQQPSEKKVEKVQEKPQEQATKQRQEKVLSTNNKGRISLADAKAKALADAGLSESAVTFIKQKLDYDDLTLVYEIEFYTSTHEYEYEIDATTGVIHERSIEKFKVAPTSKGNGQNTGGANSKNYIGLEKAKEIALARAGFNASEVTFKKAKMEYDDGRCVYEIEFWKNFIEYECTINATTGNIVEYSTEIDD